MVLTESTRRWPKNITSIGGIEEAKTMREIFSGTLISFALCFSLVITPAAADGDSFSRAYKDTLTVYGNANMDDIINEDDIEYVRGIIDGTEDETQFADANYDGQIDEDDVAQIELIIAGEEDRLVILDMNNRTVTVPMPVERIVATGYGSIHTLMQLGAEDKIVGCSHPDQWSALPYAAPELDELPDTGGPSKTNFNVELAASLEPDVIFACSSGGGFGDVDMISDKTQVPTIAVSSGEGLWFVDELRIIGAITGNDDRARDIIDYTKEKVDEITEITSKIPDEDKPVVFACGCCKSLTTSCGTTPEIELAGGLCVPGAAWGQQVSKEQIIKWNPDVIVIQWASTEWIEEVLSDPVLQNVNAVKNGRVYSTIGGYWGDAPLDQHMASVYYLAKLLYPDEFEGLDVEEEGNEIWEHLYGVGGLYTEMAEEYNFYRWN
ncbi:MAG TPA: ABC transporter substrate-binding protein [Methanothrix sp.]|nr:ABC transporter substrate-binding protein [Methanothrix sp.]